MAMTKTDKMDLKDFNAYEDELDQLDAGVVRVAEILTDVKSRHLYRFSHKSFEQYVRGRYGKSKSLAYRWVRALPVMKQLGCEDRQKVSTGVEKTPPTPRQAEILAVLPEEHREEVWQEAVETSPRGKATDKSTKAAVKAKLQEEIGVPAKVPVDCLGRAILDPKIAQDFNDAAELKAIQSDIQRIRKRVADICEKRVGRYLHQQSTDSDLKNVWSALKFALPYAICPPQARDQHKDFKALGWLPRRHYQNLPTELKWKDDGHAV